MHASMRTTALTYSLQPGHFAKCLQLSAAARPTCDPKSASATRSRRHSLHLPSLHRHIASCRPTAAAHPRLCEKLTLPAARVVATPSIERYSPRVSAPSSRCERSAASAAVLRRVRKLLRHVRLHGGLAVVVARPLHAGIAHVVKVDAGELGLHSTACVRTSIACFLRVLTLHNAQRQELAAAKPSGCDDSCMCDCCTWQLLRPSLCFFARHALAEAIISQCQSSSTYAKRLGDAAAGSRQAPPSFATSQAFVGSLACHKPGRQTLAPARSTRCPNRCGSPA